MSAKRRARGVADTARLFTHGGSQAVRLPKAYRFDGKEVAIRREGDSVILEPVEDAPLTQSDLDAFWARIDKLAAPDEEFPGRLPQEKASPPRAW